MQDDMAVEEAAAPLADAGDPGAGVPDDLAGAAARAFADLLAATHTAVPASLAELLSDHARGIGATALVVYLIDYEHRDLVPVPAPDAADRTVVRVEGSLAGRAFATFRIQDVDAEDGRRRLWLPLLDGTERLGVLEVVVPAAGGAAAPGLLAVFERYAHLSAQLIMGKGRYGDVFELVQRRRPMSVSAELQQKLLPPLLFATDGLVISGMLEPAYNHGGDSFDYAVNASGVHVAVFDALGHGLSAAVTANVAVSAYRNGRRRLLDLRGIYATADEAVAEQFGGERYVTALLAHLDPTGGTLTWIPAGHPPPLLLRGGKLVKTLAAPASTPLGVRLGGPPQVARESLEPADQILLYTDGLTEARDPEGGFFSTERLGEFLVRAAAAELPAPETLRRLRNAIMDYQGGRLQDDATAVLLQWRTDADKALMPQTV